MKKTGIFTIFMLTVFGVNCQDNGFKKKQKAVEQKDGESKQEQRTSKSFFKRMHDEFLSDMEELFEAHQKAFDSFFSQKEQFRDIKKIEITRDTDKEGNSWVVITIHLPENYKKFSDVKIKAKGNNLEGWLDYDDHKLKFFVSRGRDFGTTVEYNKESESEEKTEGKKEGKQTDNEKYRKVFASLSTQITAIPFVINLENAKANLVDHKLIIKLPSAQSKHDWTDIQVSKQEQAEPAKPVTKRPSSRPIQGYEDQKEIM